MAQKPVPVTGIHLLRLGNHVVVNAEIDGEWVEVIREVHDGMFSHIVEPAGMHRRADEAARDPGRIVPPHGSDP